MPSTVLPSLPPFVLPSRPLLAQPPEPLPASTPRWSATAPLTKLILASATSLLPAPGLGLHLRPEGTCISTVVADAVDVLSFVLQLLYWSLQYILNSVSSSDFLLLRSSVVDAPQARLSIVKLPGLVGGSLGGVVKALVDLGLLLERDELGLLCECDRHLTRIAAFCGWSLLMGKLSIGSM